MGLLAAVSACLLELKSAGVEARPGPRVGYVRDPVSISSPIGGVRYERVGAGDRPLVVDCNFARGLLEVAPTLRALGIEAVEYTSATSVRFIRGTRKLSRHAFGLALDVRGVRGPRGLAYRVDEEYERGTTLDDGECVGEPHGAGARLLKTLVCRLEESGWFRRVLSPDFDGDHWDHLHLEVRPQARSPSPERS